MDLRDLGLDQATLDTTQERARAVFDDNKVIVGKKVHFNRILRPSVDMMTCIDEKPNNLLVFQDKG